MNDQDKEIVNLIIKNHMKQFKFKISDYVIYVLPFILISVCGMVVYGFNPLFEDVFIKHYFRFIKYCFYSVLVIVSIGLIYVNITEVRQGIKRKWMLKDLNENDFIALSKCSNEFKDNIKKEMAPDGSLMYISLEQICRSDNESMKIKTKRKEIEALLK